MEKVKLFNNTNHDGGRLIWFSTDHAFSHNSNYILIYIYIDIDFDEKMSYFIIYYDAGY